MCLMSASRAWYGVVEVHSRATKSTSKPFQGAPASRAASRITRFARFLPGAFPRRFPAIKATRPQRPRSSFLSSTSAIRLLVVILCATLNREEISFVDLMVFFTSPPPSRYLGGQTQSCLRPFALLAASTALPPLVAIRERNP
jgi:hypothetical protein